MKKIIILLIINGSVFAYSQSCLEPTHQKKEFIYSLLEIPPYTPFQSICSKLGPYYGPAIVREGLYKTVAVKLSCTASCGLALLGLHFLTPDPEEAILRLKKEYPYSSIKGKKFSYGFGGGHFEYYQIRDRDDYSLMISDVRSKLNRQTIAPDAFFGVVSSALCYCSINVPF